MKEQYVYHIAQNPEEKKKRRFKKTISRPLTILIIISEVITMLAMILFAKYHLASVWKLRNLRIVYFFVEDGLNRFIVCILLIGVVSIISLGFNLYYGEWNKLVSAISVASNLVQIMIVIYVCMFPYVFDSRFSPFYEKVTLGIVVLMVIFVILDSAIKIWRMYEISKSEGKLGK